MSPETWYKVRLVARQFSFNVLGCTLVYPYAHSFDPVFTEKYFLYIALFLIGLGIWNPRE
jgi:hypothetical protein